MAKKKASKAKKPRTRELPVNLKARIGAPVVDEYNFGVELSVVIPPKIKTAGDVLDWLEGLCCEWLEAMSHMEFVRAGRKQSFASSLNYDLAQLVRAMVRALRFADGHHIDPDGHQWRHTLAECGKLMDADYRDDECRTAKMLLESATFFSGEEDSDRRLREAIETGESRAPEILEERSELAERIASLEAERAKLSDEWDDVLRRDSEVFPEGPTADG